MAELEVAQREAPSGELPLEAALRNIEIFSDLTDEQIEWFASHSEDLRLAPGDILIHEGEPADSLFVLLEGEIRGRRESGGGDGPVFTARAGQVSGMLPFSRMTHFTVVARALQPTRLARLRKPDFDEMLRVIPPLLPRLVTVLADRIREVSRADQQREKLVALGKLSAGLAHELNNPASAARRAAETLRKVSKQVREANQRLYITGLSQEQRMLLGETERKMVDDLGTAPPLDSLAESDRQEEIEDWLKKNGVHDQGSMASGLVETGLDNATLDRLARAFDRATLSDVLIKLVANIEAEKLTRDIESATGRISELVRAVKEYSFMDQQPQQEIDLHQGIDSTLTMLKFRLKHGVNVSREYDAKLPRVFAHGSELNQIWTNLVDNAIDAMQGKGELRIRTVRELDYALVEVIDNGPGIPEEVKPHLFEPFFTTKGVGAGTGLGLDTVYRIVRNHHGQVTVQSRPGETRFQVRLPLSQPK